MSEISTIGEQLVGRWLQLKNHDLLAQNWRCRWGEIDLIAQDKATKAIAFVEVKTRSHNNWDEDGLFAVNSLKQQKIIQTASLFLAKHPHLAELPCSFDVGLVSYRVGDAAINSLQTLQQIERLEIEQSIGFKNYLLTIKKYLPAAFD